MLLFSLLLFIVTKYQPLFIKAISVITRLDEVIEITVQKKSSIASKTSKLIFRQVKIDYVRFSLSNVHDLILRSHHSEPEVAVNLGPHGPYEGYFDSSGRGVVVRMRDANCESDMIRPDNSSRSISDKYFVDYSSKILQRKHYTLESPQLITN